MPRNPSSSQTNPTIQTSTTVVSFASSRCCLQHDADGGGAKDFMSLVYNLRPNQAFVICHVLLFCLFVCLTICMHVCMYACMYVCILSMSVHVYMYIHMGGQHPVPDRTVLAALNLHEGILSSRMESKEETRSWLKMPLALRQPLPFRNLSITNAEARSSDPAKVCLFQPRSERSCSLP